MKKKKFLEGVSKFYVILGFLFLSISLVLIAFPIAPYIMYRLNPNLTDTEIDNISKEVVEDVIVPTEVNIKESDLPLFDSSLPEDPYLLIPTIKVSSPIDQTKDPEESLKDGTWMAPEYGQPDNNSLPIIVAAHRFGYVYWDRKTRNRVSFFNLPKTQIDDTVEIIWNQRKYIYRIYAEDESTYIKDYQADLILYTCKYFNSPQRIFRYAMRVN
jgi:sortase (surface protein transpeptidase)